MITIEEQQKRERVADLLLKLKKMNRTYQVCNEEQRGRLLSASEGLLNSLVAEGFERSFVETLLICGKEFLDTLYKKPEADTTEATYEDARVIFS